MYKILITLMVAIVGGVIGVKLKIPAGALVGAMVAVAVYNISTGQGNIPKNFRTVAQIVVGGIIGLNFTTEAFFELKKIIVPTIILVIALISFSILLGFLIHKLTGIDLITMLFSCAPGGLADMTLISEAYGADTTKVVAMHLARLITVIAILPAIIKLFATMIKK